LFAELILHDDLAVVFAGDDGGAVYADIVM
jgi:hypothetical protein